jgi:hypothetical protein
MPPLTKLLAETAPYWSKTMAPIAESLARQFLGVRGRKKSARLPTPLTQDNRSAGRDRVRTRPRSNIRPKRPALPRKCITCGAEITLRRSWYCSSCQSSESLSKANQALQARRRAGDDPAHGGEATHRRSQRQKANRRAEAEWEREHPEALDPDLFAREIRPRLAGVPLAAMVRATGLSQPYCAMIRRGQRVPHPRHWEALGALVAQH